MTPSVTETIAAEPAAVLSTTGDAQKSKVLVNGVEKKVNPPQLQVQGKTKDGRKLKMRAPPKFDSLEDERLYRKQHLAAACRAFADRRFDEGVAGHISVRDPILTDHFCKCALFHVR